MSETSIKDNTGYLRQKQEYLQSICAWMLGATVSLIGLGLVLVYSASAVRAERYGWSLFFAEKQLFWIILGSIAMFIASRLDYHLFLKLRWPIVLLCIFLLGVVVFANVGTKVNGAQRWLRYGGYSFQPSELAKIFLVIAVAGFVHKAEQSGKISLRKFCFLLTIVLVSSGLIAVEPDLGTAILLSTVLFAMIFAGGVRLLHIGTVLLLTLPLVLIFVSDHLSYVLERITAWLEGGSQGKAYHAYMSLQTLASGGLYGVGVGRGWAKLWYLPEAHTDFIFSVAGQEFGLIGTFAIILAFSIIVYSGICLVKVVPDAFGVYLAFGLTLMLGLQAAFNIAVVTASIPTKGISLPFVSFGGSGLVCSMFAVGVLCSISRHAFKAERHLVVSGTCKSAWGACLLSRLSRAEAVSDGQD